jgi:hypothetical protein
LQHDVIEETSPMARNSTPVETLGSPSAPATDGTNGNKICTGIAGKSNGHVQLASPLRRTEKIIVNDRVS